MQRDRWIAIAVLLPSLILLAVFVYGFIGQTFYISLTDWGDHAPLAVNPEYKVVGFRNYVELFTGFLYSRFRQGLINAFFYTLFLVVGSLGVGLILAILLDRAPKAEGLFRTIFLYPMSLSFIVTGTIWRWLLTPKGGINALPRFIGLPQGDFLWMSSRQQVLRFDWQLLPVITACLVALVLIVLAVQAWRNGRRRRCVAVSIPALALILWATLGSRYVPAFLPYRELHGFNLATIGIIMAAVWQYAGYTMALYIAGLRGIPQHLHEVAQLDGVNEFQYYTKIAIPILKPITFSAIIILAHVSLKLFALIFAMAGSDNAATGHPSILMFLTTFRGNKFAVGAAIAVVLFVLVAVFIIPYLANSYRERRAQ